MEDRVIVSLQFFSVQTKTPRLSHVADAAETPSHDEGHFQLEILNVTARCTRSAEPDANKGFHIG